MPLAKSRYTSFLRAKKFLIFKIRGLSIGLISEKILPTVVVIQLSSIIISLKSLPSQHTQTVPARVPYVIPHGARTGFPAGTRRFLSGGSRRVPGGTAHPVRQAYPYGSRLPKLVGTRKGNARDGLSRLGPVWIPRTKIAGKPVWAPPRKV